MSEPILIDQLKDRVKALNLPTRAGRCNHCLDRYDAGRLDVIRCNGVWLCLACAKRIHSAAEAVRARRALIAELESRVS